MDRDIAWWTPEQTRRALLACSLCLTVLGHGVLQAQQTGAPARGPAGAPVILEVYSDFECPYCRAFARTLGRVGDTFGDTVRLIFRQYPLRRIHPHAQKAAEASLCAHDQRRFWPMHDLLFAEPQRLEVADLEEKARRLGLDGPAFDACLESGRQAERVEEDRNRGRAAGVNATPTLFLNGALLTDRAVSYSVIEAAIRAALARSKRQR